MSAPLHRLADRWDVVADVLVAAAVPVDPGGAVLGVDDAPGAPGEVAGELRRQILDALHARAREADRAAAAVVDLATAVRSAAARYAGTDRTAAERAVTEPVADATGWRPRLSDLAGPELP